MTSTGEYGESFQKGTQYDRKLNYIALYQYVLKMESLGRKEGSKWKIEKQMNWEEIQVFTKVFIDR